MPYCPVHPDDFFSRKDLLYEHAKNSDEHHYCCDVCERVFVNASSLTEHITAKHSSLAGTALEQHTVGSHAGYICPVCDKPFTSASAREQHAANKPKSHDCQICNITFLSKADMQQHAAENHGLICLACNMPFDSQVALQKHTSRVHGGSHICNLCNKPFQSQVSMMKHMDTHGGSPSPSPSQESNSSNSEIIANGIQTDPADEPNHDAFHTNPSVMGIGFDPNIWAIPDHPSLDVAIDPWMRSPVWPLQELPSTEHAPTYPSTQNVPSSNPDEPDILETHPPITTDAPHNELCAVALDSQITLPRIYKNLVSVLDARIAKLEATSESAGYADTLRTCVDSMTGNSIVLSLVNRFQCRTQLMALSSKLGCQDELEIREAIDQDESDIIQMFQDVLNCEADKKAVLHLQGADAERFLSLIHELIDNIGCSSDGDGQHFRKCAHRLLVKLSETCGILPPSLRITGVQNCGKDPVAGGGFADIFRATYRGEEVALKRLRDFQQRREITHRNLCREALFWQGLEHPNVLPFYGVELDAFLPRLSMVSPWMQHGTIMNHIADKGGPLAVNVDRYLLEIAHGLQYLHSRNIAHGDLRGTNIFIDSQWHVRLADFGLAGFANATFVTCGTSSSAGSIRWMAPELLYPEAFDLKQLRRTDASDIYAFACVGLEIYTAREPFCNIAKDTAVIPKVMQGERPARPVNNTGKTFSEDLWNLIQLCWQQQPLDRPKIEDVVPKIMVRQTDNICGI